MALKIIACSFYIIFQWGLFATEILYCNEDKLINK